MLISLGLNAQKRTLVADKSSSKPLPNVNISHKDKGLSTTDKDGYFNQSIFNGLTNSDTITFSCIGYSIKKISVAYLQQNHDTIFLTPQAEPLTEVTIDANKIEPLRYLPYTELARMKNAVFSFGFSLVGSKIYIIGGDESRKNEYYDAYEWEQNYRGMQIYDIEADEWILSDIKFSKRAYHNAHYLNGKIFIIGGKYLGRNRKIEFLNKEVEVYDLNKHTLISSETNVHPAVNFASAVYDDNIIIIGGSTGSHGSIKIGENKIKKEYTNKSHAFNTATGYWYELNDFNLGIETKSIAVHDTIYLIGGSGNIAYHHISTYHPKTGEYRKEDVQSRVNWERPALACNNDIIYIFENETLSTYNIDSKTINHYSLPLKLTDCEMVYYDNNLYIIGGRTTEVMILSKDTEAIIFIPSDKLYKVPLENLHKTRLLH